MKNEEKKVQEVEEKEAELTEKEMEQVTGGMKPNVAGTIGTAVAAGTVITMFGGLK